MEQWNVSSITVNPGDTLSDIAKRLKTTVNHLKDVNNIKDVDKINPGMALKY
ncbi:MAG: LysM peptidoglycan-binding domain-containing protein [Lachnospiraceae bacterium]|nr:LysM peptidoglycan-binding domain-containing protein [Lachnospiraceae bacterium]